MVAEVTTGSFLFPSVQSNLTGSNFLPNSPCLWLLAHGDSYYLMYVWYMMIHTATICSSPARSFGMRYLAILFCQFFQKCLDDVNPTPYKIPCNAGSSVSERPPSTTPTLLLCWPLEVRPPLEQLQPYGTACDVDGLAHSRLLARRVAKPFVWVGI
jgi:hypothetical protein